MITLMNMSRMNKVAIVCCTAALSTGLAAEPPRYRVTLIDPVQTAGGATPIGAQAINDKGWVVGSYGTQAFGDPYGYRTVLWKPGQGSQDIGQPPNLPTLLPIDLNNDGVIVGKASDALIGLDTRGHTFSWKDGQFTVFQQIVPNRYAHPGHTNNAGRIIGYANDGSFIGTKAVEYIPGGAITQLMPEAQGYNTALDVNDLNVILGTEIRGAYLWFPGAPDRFIFPAPVTLPYVDVAVLNDLNDIVGEAREGGHSETTTAAVWLDGQGWRFIPRNARRNRAVAINSRREVVGNSQDNAGAIGNHGWYWTPETGAAIPLEDLIVDPPEVYAVSLARDINENGQIVAGLFVRATSEGRTAILTPIEVLCYPNCDSSSAAPVLNVSDFICFLNQYAAQSPAANCDGSTTAPTLNVSDFVCFLNAYATGCP